jgi:queuine/archaeosine tRNA-ribosyltransferase
MILDECISYAEDNKIPEFPEISKMIKDKAPIISKQTKLLQLIMQLPGKYPDLYKKIAEQIEKIDSELLGEITRDMKEEEAIGLLELIKEELDQVDKFSSKYLKET